MLTISFSLFPHIATCLLASPPRWMCLMKTSLFTQYHKYHLLCYLQNLHSSCVDMDWWLEPMWCDFLCCNHLTSKIDFNIWSADGYLCHVSINCSVYDSHVCLWYIYISTKLFYFIIWMTDYVTCHITVLYLYWSFHLSCTSLNIVFFIYSFYVCVCVCVCVCVISTPHTHRHATKPLSSIEHKSKY